MHDKDLMSNVKVQNSNEIQSPNNKFVKRGNVLSLNQFDIDLAFGF
jgi:hypothetical protein